LEIRDRGGFGLKWITSVLKKRLWGYLGSVLSAVIIIVMPVRD
jgi:hypothetical protein